MNRFFLLQGLGALAVRLFFQTPTTVAEQPKNVPPVVKNGIPGPMHHQLNQLVGNWTVSKEIYVAGGTPTKPLRGMLTCRRAWIAGGRFLQDVTSGKLGMTTYYRLGVLGYSNMDRSYEWNTVDAFNTNMMSYRSTPGANPTRSAISMRGTFTDQGVLGSASVGKKVGMRTVIQFHSADEHTFLLYMTPPGGREFLADRSVYSRQKPAGKN